MKKIILCLVVVFLFLNCSSVYSRSYESQHFIIHSDLDSRYVKIIQSNIESFYEKILSEFFSKGWETPLAIYYSETQSDTQKLIAGFGYNDEIHYGIYVSALKAIFTHRKMDSGGLSGLGTVYHEIVHRFVDLNYDRPPTWFNEGLATFLPRSGLIHGERDPATLASLGHDLGRESWAEISPVNCYKLN